MNDGDRPTVFISCGQVTEDERELGRSLAALVESQTPCRGYFAQNQQSLRGVSENILAALYRSVAFVAVMHHRGTVTTPSGGHIRGSVWVEQEIAIASFMTQVLDRPLPVALYIQEGIRREGLRDQLLLNAVEFRDNSEVLEDFKNKIATGYFGLLTGRNDAETASPLGSVPEVVSLKHRASNPDFQFGVRIRPKYYRNTVHPLDQSDDQFFNELYSEVAARLEEQLAMKQTGHGILFSTPDRPWNATEFFPDGKIYVQSDGEVVVRFSQGSESPLSEWMRILAVAYYFAQRTFRRFNLRPIAIVEVDFYLHAGRKDFQPTLPTAHNETFEVDLSKQSFADVFAETIMVALRKEGRSTTAEEVKSMLRSTVYPRLPQLRAIESSWLLHEASPNAG